MTKLKKLISKLKKIPKTRYIAILAVLVLMVAIAIPTLSRFKNRIDINALLSDENNWDGTIATSYRNGTGTSSDPYIISNAKELAYFSKMLHETSYEGEYFELANDIIINNGVFDYNEENITYTLNKTETYLEAYTTNIYTQSDLSGEKIASINKFNTLNNFKGHFNGNYYTIYGLYITSDIETELALFKNLKGEVENLYLENTLIYGGSTTAALATTASNAKIKDIFIDGDVVGTTDKVKKVEVLDVEENVFEKTEENLLETITLPSSTKTSLKVILKGTYETTEENQKIILNGVELEPGDFSISLGTELLENITLEVNDEVTSTITLTNLKYEVTYHEDTTAVSAGVIAKVSSSTIKNVINKAKVYSTNEASGLFGTISNTDIEKAYNTAPVKAVNTASGIVGKIENSLSETVISNVYNDGSLSAITTSSFVDKILNNASVTIENSFNTKEAFYSINQIENTTVTVNNILDTNLVPVNIGKLTGEITTNAEVEIDNAEKLKDTLNFKEYVDATDLSENKDNAWIYEEGYLPILYFDDLNNPIATLYVGTYSWNDLGYELKNIYIKNQIGFSIESNDELNKYKEAYYYIHNDAPLATREEVGQITNWSKYDGVVKLSEEGTYTIYVKVLDKNDTVTYLNSERLVIDLAEPTIEIKMAEKLINKSGETSKNINILEDKEVSIAADGGYAEVTSIKYHVATKELTEEELLEVEWTDYEEPYKLTECGNYVIYVKTIDAANRVTFINSENIIYGGYTEKISLGKDNEVTDEVVNITSKSSITYNFKYEEERTYREADSNNIISSIVLPKNTIMTLIDNTTNEVYKYKITSDDDFGYSKSCQTDDCNKYATYPLKNFVKVGQTDKTNVFNDENFTNNKKKDLSLTLDFSKTDVKEKLTFKLHLELKNKENSSVVSTLIDTIKEVNIYPNQDVTFVINKLNETSTIKYNSDSETEINLETYLSNKTIDNSIIYDTTSLNKKLGIAIYLIDKEEKLVGQEHLKNIHFQVGDKLYTPDNDGITRINLSENTDKVTTTLKVITYLSTTKLDLGDYNFVISPYVAADGFYTDKIDTTKVLIPVTVTNKKESGYGFKAVITTFDEDNNETPFTSIISKTKEEAEEVIEIPTTRLRIKILDTTKLTAKRIKVSLYKRISTTAAEQEYELVDLKDFVTNDLPGANDKTYDLTENPKELIFDNKKFENNGYELRFELYDGTRKITTAKKKFIVK